MRFDRFLLSTARRLNSVRPAKGAVQLLTTLFVVSLSLCLFPNLAVAASPHIYDVPQAGLPGSQTTLVGNGFDPNATLDLYFDSTDVGLVDTDNNGTFGMALKAPTIRQNGGAIQIPENALQGTHTITAVERITQLQAQVPFTVQFDWPQFHFDAQRTGFNPHESVLSPDTVGNLTLNWQNTTASASPVVANGVLYVGTYGDNASALVALNASTGALLWTFPIYDEIRNSAPAVANGIVYVGTNQYAGYLYALNASTGALLWRHAIRGGIGSSPAVANGIVYVGRNVLSALNATTGALLWEFSGPDFSSPAVANGIVYVGSDNLWALNATTGALVWESPFGGGSSPAVVNGVVYLGAYTGTFYALNASTGVLLWSNVIGANGDSTPVVANGVVYVNTGSIDALDAGTGAILWTSAVGGGAPVVANGVVYLGSGDLNTYALNASTGAVLWKYRMESYIETSPAVVNGMLYIVDEDGNLDAFGLPNQQRSEKFSPPQRPDPARLTPNWSLQPGQPVTSKPIKPQ